MLEWSGRWYVPLVVLGAALLALLGAALAGVEMLTTSAQSDAGAPHIWTTHLVRVDQALARGDTGAALSSWREAHAAAVRSQQWEGMLEVGDAARRFPGGSPRARQAYLTALFRARHQHSLDGMLGAAAGFGELGDHDVLAQALRLAEREAGADLGARARVKSIADRWPRTPLRTERRDSRMPGGDLP